MSAGWDPERLANLTIVQLSCLCSKSPEPAEAGVEATVMHDSVT